MNHLYCIMLLAIFVKSPALASVGASEQQIRGIYLGQQSLTNTQRLTDFIRLAEETGINTFVIDLHSPGPAYRKNIRLVSQRGIKYIARLVVFPGGASPSQIQSDSYLKQKLDLALEAVRLGAHAVQLDYIRYSTRQKPGPENAGHILGVLSQFRKIMEESRTPLHIAVFGEAMFFESQAIGQNLPLFAESVEAISPMLYPSHYQPWQEHSANPYKTITDSLQALPAQFGEKEIPFGIIPYIEMYNVRVYMNAEVRQRYIMDQIRAVTDHSTTGGWIAWSAGNKYHHLFKVLLSLKKDKSGEQAY